MGEVKGRTLHTLNLTTTIKLVMNIEYFILIISLVSFRREGGVGALQDHMALVYWQPRASVVKIYDNL